MKKTGEEIITKFRDMEIIQRNDFQNFTLDSVLLGEFAKINRKTKKILDIGTGCGILPLILSKRSKAFINAIEIQEKMVEVSNKNILNNNLTEKVKIIHGDIKNYKKIFQRDEFDMIITNPPYFEYKGDLNQINDLDQLAIARHNIDLTMENILEAVNYLLKNGGTFSIVFRSERLVELLILFNKYKIEPKRMKNVFTKTNKDSKICLLEGIKNAEKGFKIENPIYIYDENGEKTDYVKQIYNL